jgi:hypothetical protein
VGSNQPRLLFEITFREIRFSANSFGSKDEAIRRITREFRGSYSQISLIGGDYKKVEIHWTESQIKTQERFELIQQRLTELEITPSVTQRTIEGLFPAHLITPERNLEYSKQLLPLKMPAFLLWVQHEKLQEAYQLSYIPFFNTYSSFWIFRVTPHILTTSRLKYLMNERESGLEGTMQHLIWRSIAYQDWLVFQKVAGVTGFWMQNEFCKDRFHMGDGGIFFFEGWKEGEYKLCSPNLQLGWELKLLLHSLAYKNTKETWE